jgi:xylulose-5-phosphate/fructose-6-phosphate phosphoketolase
MRVQNGIDRFSLVKDVCRMVPNLGSKGVYLSKLMSEKLVEHKEYIHEFGVDMPEVSNWKWTKEK